MLKVGEILIWKSGGGEKMMIRVQFMCLIFPILKKIIPGVVLFCIIYTPVVFLS